MEWTVISLGLSYLGVSIAFMGLMWRMFKNQSDGIYRRFETIDQRFEAIDKRFENIDGRFDRVEDKIDSLARDHQGLARELSEFRGEMRGRLGDPASVTS